MKVNSIDQAVLLKNDRELVNLDNASSQKDIEPSAFAFCTLCDTWVYVVVVVVLRFK